MELFLEINEKTGRNLQGLKQHLLSQSGKEVMIKSVALSLNTYATSHFKLPAAYHTKLRQDLTHFFWEGHEGRNHICWISWRRLCKSKERGGLGFREPQLQNKALLGKLAWRLWSDPTSYWAEYLKQLYFPHTTFLDASLGSNPSWAWRGILEGHKVLTSSPQYRPQQRVFVAELIDEENQTWRMDLLRELFHPEDVAAIIKIPLSLFLEADHQVWGEPVMPISLRRFGSRYGNARLPPKIRNLLWRACSSGIASRIALSQRNILVGTACPRCGHPEETVDHLLLDCAFARAAWFGSKLGFSPPPDNPQLSSVIQSWIDWSRVEKKQGQDIAGLAAYMCWNLWKARNALVFNGVEGSPLEVISISENQFQEYKAALQKPAYTAPRSTFELQQELPTYCRPPPLNGFKLNIDAAFSKDHSSLGYVIRNDKGSIIVAVSEPLQFASILQGEALAIRHGLILSISEGVEWLQVESDNQQVIRLINSDSPPPFEIASIVKDIKLLMTYIRTCSFSFIPGEINSVADSLARRAKSVAGTTSWPVSTPWL
ncbi:uncharacterized protein LOC122655307 [Telopea speciosissima]|uniref:uncharacterized protein LOC122655307 n=1 Tax=Telopea speciosissima TaxID=54955 RepID=UPI001CC81965|nr:uncharacterized protein LOC122655307 [Telopea speciosissima]